MHDYPSMCWNTELCWVLNLRAVKMVNHQLMCRNLPLDPLMYREGLKGWHGIVIVKLVLETTWATEIWNNVIVKLEKHFAPKKYFSPVVANIMARKSGGTKCREIIGKDQVSISTAHRCINIIIVINYYNYHIRRQPPSSLSGNTTPDYLSTKFNGY